MDLTADQIQKFKKLSFASLEKLATKHFNAFIRKRDKHLTCINCGNYTTLQAGHYFAAGKHKSIRFHEHNVNGECLQCNYYDSQSHAHKYRPNLIKKIGQANFDELEFLSKIRTAKPYDRFYLITIILKYKDLI